NADDRGVLHPFGTLQISSQREGSKAVWRGIFQSLNPDGSAGSSDDSNMIQVEFDGTQGIKVFGPPLGPAILADYSKRFDNIKNYTRETPNYGGFLDGVIP